MSVPWNQMRYRIHVTDSDFIYCTPGLACKLLLPGMQRLVAFTKKHEFDYYHNVKIFDEIFGINEEKLNLKPAVSVPTLKNEDL